MKYVHYVGVEGAEFHREREFSDHNDKGDCRSLRLALAMLGAERSIKEVFWYQGKETHILKRVEECNVEAIPGSNT